MEDTTVRMTADQASGNPAGHLVLNGTLDSPVTTIARDASGADIRADSAEAALDVLGGQGHRYSEVKLVTHDFPDADGGALHTVAVWVPHNQGG